MDLAAGLIFVLNLSLCPSIAGTPSLSSPPPPHGWPASQSTSLSPLHTHETQNTVISCSEEEWAASWAQASSNPFAPNPLPPPAPPSRLSPGAGHCLGAPLGTQALAVRYLLIGILLYTS